MRSAVVRAAIAMLVTAAPSAAWETPQETQWARVLGQPGIDRVWSVRRNRAGAFLLAGSTWGAQGSRVWAARIERDGQVAWQKSYGRGTARSLEPLPGGCVLAGDAPGAVAGDRDAWAMKLGPSGYAEWRVTYGGPGVQFANAIRPTRDGGYVLVGQSGSSCWVLKLAANGQVSWQNEYHAGAGLSEQGYAVALTSDGGYVVAGRTYAANGSGQRAWVLKLDASGGVVWEKAFSALVSSAESIVAARDGGYVFAGRCRTSGTPGTDAWVVKLDEGGAIEWGRAVDFGGSDSAHSVVGSRDGGWVVVGDCSMVPERDAWVMKLTSWGSLDWANVLDGPGTQLAASVDRVGTVSINEGYVFAGFLSGGAGAGDEAFVCKVDRDGRIPDCPSLRPGEVTTRPTPASTVDTHATVKATDASTSATPSLVASTDLGAWTRCFYRPPPTATQTFCEAHPWHVMCTLCDEYPELAVCDEDPEYYVILDELHAVHEDAPDRWHKFHPAAGTRAKTRPTLLDRIHWELTPMLLAADLRAVPPQAAKRLAALFERAPTGEVYTEALRGALLERFADDGASPRSLLAVAKALNALELDALLRRADDPGGAVMEAAARTGAAAFARAREARGPDELPLVLGAGVPGFLPGFLPGWPLAHFASPGARERSGPFEVELDVRGFSFVGGAYDLRLFEWNEEARTYRDVTTHFDPGRGRIRGRTERLSTYVVLSPARPIDPR